MIRNRWMNLWITDKNRTDKSVNFIFMVLVSCKCINKRLVLLKSG